MAHVIVTVTCNPAVDVTYRLDSLMPGEVHRVSEVAERPGGKGVNVARVLHQLGEETMATGLATRAFDEAVRSLGLPAAFVHALPQVRRTLVVHEDRRTTSLWEPGPVAAPDAAERLEAVLRDLLATARTVVVSGSLPEGVCPTLPSRLAGACRQVGVPVVLDLDGDPLRAAVDAGGAVLTPNLDELSRLLGVTGPVDVAAAARELSRTTGAPVVVTLGAAGMLATAGGSCWHARVPERLSGNPTGAGDSAAAAIARGLARGDAWPTILADAVALSAAAVLAPVAGEVVDGAYRRWHTAVHAVPVSSFVLER